MNIPTKTSNPTVTQHALRRVTRPGSPEAAVEARPANDTIPQSMNRSMNRPSILQALRSLSIAVILLLAASILPAQTTRTIPAGSYIIDMGVSPQTVANALKPYGMVYDLLGRKTRILWSINQAKGKDGVDFTIGNRSFRGGPFIIEAPYRTAEVESRITYWQGLGVVGYTTTSR